MQVFGFFCPLQNIKDATIPTKIENGSTFNSKVMTQASPRRRRRKGPICLAR